MDWHKDFYRLGSQTMNSNDFDGPLYIFFSATIRLIFVTSSEMLQQLLDRLA